MYSELIEFGTKLILDCGRQLANKREQENICIQEKNGCSDIVTIHDHWVQEYLYHAIKCQYPYHGFWGEEDMENFSIDKQRDVWSWIIDPIDGTGNYAATGRDYAISIALCREGFIYYGWVYDVAQDVLYQGMAEPMKLLGNVEKPQESLLDMGYKTERELEKAGIDIVGLEQRFRGIRYLGCASLELCRVAMGKRVYLNTHLMPWDYAAAAAILSSKGVAMRAALTSKGKFCVCAYRSESVYEECKRILPVELTERMELVTGSRIDAAIQGKEGRKKYA